MERERENRETNRQTERQTERDIERERKTKNGKWMMSGTNISRINNHSF